MITANTPVSIHANGISREAFFSIKQENAPHLFSVLRNQLYSDKVMAVLREYSTNAADAHVQAGCPQRPIQVALPSLLSPILSIRDFGTGLSEEDVFNVFASYGESTKRNTNEQTGMLGLGSKSAFSYVSSFTVVSYHDGVRVVYAAYLDESGLGKISRLFDESTTEEDGLEIQVEVRRDDIKHFIAAAKSLYAHWAVRPHLLGDSEVNRALEDYDDLLQRSTLASGESWRIKEKRGVEPKILCVMGNVSYEVSSSYLKGESAQWVSRLPYYITLNLELPIGAVQPVASREGLEYNQFTIASLDHYIGKARQELLDQLNSRIANAETMWEARCIVADMGKLVSGFSSCSWRGLPVPTDVLNISGYSGLDVVRLHISDRNQWIKKSSQQCQIYPKKKTIFFVDYDAVPKVGRFKRIEQHMQRHGLSFEHHECFYLHFTNQADAVRWMNLQEFKGAPCHDIKDLPLKMERAPLVPRQKDNAVVMKAMERAFVYNGTFHRSVKSHSWDATHVDLEEGEGVYVLLDSFLPQDLCVDPDLFAFDLILKQLSKLGCAPEKVHGFKKALAPKIGKGWKTLREHIQENLLERLEDKDMQISLHHVWAFSHVARYYFDLASHVEFNSVEMDAAKTMSRFLNRIHSLKRMGDTVDVVRGLTRNVKGMDIVVNRRLRELCVGETDDLYRQVQAIYPFLHKCCPHLSRDSDDFKIALDYINLVDGQA